jgi:phage recombination protein Bet
MSQTFSIEQIALIKNTIARGATDDELELFLATCRRTGLDPFSRQIYMIERRFKDKQGNWAKKMEIQVSIDGLRVIAERTGVYQGQDGPYWCGPDGQWTDVWLHQNPPLAAKLGVLKSTFSKPLWSVAKWSSYAQTYQDGNPTAMWKKMPDLMLGKCAEALALRRAFPNDMSGLYTGEEMSQAEIAARDTEVIAHTQPAQIAAPQDTVMDIIRSSPQREAVPVMSQSQSQEMRDFISDIEQTPPMPDSPPEHQWAPSSGPVMDDERDPRAPSGPEIDPAHYKISFGKHTGKTIRQVGIKESRSYLAWMEEQASKQGKPLSPNVQQFKTAVIAHERMGR